MSVSATTIYAEWRGERTASLTRKKLSRSYMSGGFDDWFRKETAGLRSGFANFSCAVKEICVDFCMLHFRPKKQLPWFVWRCWCWLGKNANEHIGKRPLQTWLCDILYAREMERKMFSWNIYNPSRKNCCCISEGYELKHKRRGQQQSWMFDSVAAIFLSCINMYLMICTTKKLWIKFCWHPFWRMKVTHGVNIF